MARSELWRTPIRGVWETDIEPAQKNLEGAVENVGEEKEKARP